MLPAWVEADPSREIGVDPLRLEYLADRIADRILPGMSVLTRRARYLSFLCWALDRTRGAGSVTTAIHRLEGELALFEAERHLDGSECPAVIGRERVRRQLAPDRPRILRPERLFKSSAFPQYRALMRSLGLVEGRRRPNLTREGLDLAGAYRSAARGRVSCLSDISHPERVLLSSLLGVDRYRSTDARRARRYEVLQLLQRTLGRVAGEFGAFLELHGRRPSRDPLLMDLHRAYVWNLLVRGLRSVFLGLIPIEGQTVKSATMIGALRTALTTRRSVEVEPIGDVANAKASEIARSAVADLRQALALNPSEIGLDGEARGLAGILVHERNPRGFVEQLVLRHISAKGVEAWVRLESDGRVRRIAPPSKKLPTAVGFFDYRLGAFSQLARDLERL